MRKKILILSVFLIPLCLFAVENKTEQKEKIILKIEKFKNYLDKHETRINKDVLKNIKAYLIKSKKEKVVTIKWRKLSLKQAVDRLRKCLVGKVTYHGIYGIVHSGDRKTVEFPTKNVKSNAIASSEKNVKKLKKELAHLKKTAYYARFPHRFKPKVDSIGRLHDKITIIQIIDEKVMICKVYLNERYYEDEYNVWIKGIKTDKYTDDDVISLSKYVFYVSGTKQYKTVRGSRRTILEFEKIRMSDYKKYNKAKKLLKKYKSKLKKLEM